MTNLPAAHARPWSPRRFGLSLKLGLLIISVLALAIVLVTVLLLRLEQESLTAEMMQRGLTMARDLAGSAKTHLLANDDLSLSLLVQDTMKDPDVVYLAFTDPAGTIVAHTDLSLIGKSIQRPDGLAPAGAEMQARPYTHPAHGRLFEFTTSLSFSEVPLGALYLGFSRRAIDEALGRARNQAILVSGIMALVGIAGAVTLSILVSRPVLRLAVATRAIAAGDYQVSLPVPARDEIGLLTMSFNRMAKSLREKEMIKRAFTRYVAREVVDEILKHPERPTLQGERRDVTVLFADMRGFTALTERLSPEEVFLLLNEYYTLMIETTFKHDGTLDRFLGDGVMAIFGAPTAHHDHSLRAIRTAVAVQAAITGLSAGRIREGRDPIAVGIGCSAGEVVAGTVGREDRLEYAVIGESVVLAARLQSLAKPGQILMSHRTYQNVAGLVRVEPLGTLAESGTREQVAIYEVRGLVEAA